MRYCLEIAVRGRVTRPIHFCFAAEDDRDDVVSDLVARLRSAEDDDVVTAHRAGFLKRDFVSFEVSDEDDEGRDDSAADGVDPIAAAERIATDARREGSR